MNICNINLFVYWAQDVPSIEEKKTQKRAEAKRSTRTAQDTHKIFHFFCVRSIVCEIHVH